MRSFRMQSAILMLAHAAQAFMATTLAQSASTLPFEFTSTILISCATESDYRPLKQPAAFEGQG